MNMKKELEAKRDKLKLYEVAEMPRTSNLKPSSGVIHSKAERMS